MVNANRQEGAFVKVNIKPSCCGEREEALLEGTNLLFFTFKNDERIISVLQNWTGSITTDGVLKCAICSSASDSC